MVGWKDLDDAPYFTERLKQKCGRIEGSNSIENYWKMRIKFFILYAAFFLAGCEEKKTGADLKLQHIEITIGEPAEDFQRKYSGLIDIDQLPAGINFYKVEWDNRNKGVVRLKTDSQNLNFRDVLEFTGIESKNSPDEGISEVGIISSPIGREGIHHQQALEKFNSILRETFQSGWKPLIQLGAPRIKGREVVTYKSQQNTHVTPDGGYSLSFEEWMMLENFSSWEFEKHGIFLSISFNRNQEMLHPSKPSVYLFNFNLKSSDEYFKQYVHPLKRENWKEQLPAELEKLRIERKSAEKLALEIGYRIDTTYVDPVYSVQK